MKATWRYPVAYGLVVAAIVLLWLTPYDEPVIVLVPPLVLAAYVGGLSVGLAATIAATIAATYLLSADHTAFTSHDGLRIGALLVSGTLVSVLCEMLRRAKRRAQRSERMYSESFHASPVAMMLIDLATGNALDANEAHAQLTGWSPAETRSIPSSQRMIIDDASRETIVRRISTSGSIRDIHVTVRCKDGTLRDAHLSGFLVERGAAFITLVDVTEQKRAQIAMVETEQRFTELANTIDEVFWLTDVSKRTIFYTSPAYQRVWGRTCESLYANPRQWIDAVHPDDRGRVIANALKAGEAELEFRIVRPDGEVRWIRNRSFRVVDEAGTVVRMAGVATDITDRRKLELELQQAQKMESLGRLAGGVAHDFNNVLAVIATNSSMLADVLPQTGEERELVGEIEHAVARASGLTRQLLAFSRKQVAEPVVLDVNSIIAETRKMLRRMIGEDIALETSLEAELPHVKIDPGHLVQVIMNLAVNARDAMPEGGKLVIDTRAFSDAVVLSVTDTGCGMTPDVRARAFEPFFTTKGTTKGTGMGLAVVHGIIQQAGGHIDIDTEVGRGTTFRIYLPTITAPLDERRDAKELKIPGGSETVLVVDDDPHVRAATTRALRSSGYNATDASDGASALCLLATTKYDLLVTDVVMPGMNGRELAETAVSVYPELKVLYTSGYTDDEVVARGVMRGEVEMLDKPFRADKLAAKVRQVLDA